MVVFVTLFVTLAPLGFPFAKVDGNAFRVALTMGYFFGAVVLMAHAFGIPFYIAVGAVLFGDHCSPISDTTILSSTGAECDLVEHIKTQLPYAAVNGIIAFIAYIIAGLTGSEAALGFAVVALVVVMAVLNRISAARLAGKE